MSISTAGSPREQELKMDLEHARKIVDSLAQGINPVTGEALVPDSPYNEPEIIRALFVVHEAAAFAPRPKLTNEEKRQKNLDQGRPGNAGLPWTESDRARVAGEFADGKSIGEIAGNLERSPGAIHAELVRQGLVSPEFQ